MCFLQIGNILVQKFVIMRRRIFWLAFFLLLKTMCLAQSFSDIEIITQFLGSGSPEELDSDEVERLSDFLVKPLLINHSTQSTLESGGFLSTFQAASVIEYRKLHGDIMSYNELASLDGFNQETVNRIRPFISLDAGNIASQRYYPTDVEIALKGGYKFSPLSSVFDGSLNHGIKFKIEKTETFSISLSASNSYDALSLKPDTYSGNIACSLRKVPLRFIIGDFNARFAQGLTLWNGMSMSGLASPMAYVRNQTGVKPTWSYTGASAFTGAAVESAFGRLRISGLIALPGCKTKLKSFLPAMNVSWYGKNMRCGLTHYSEINLDGLMEDMKTAVDLSICIRGVDVFSEVSADWRNIAASALAGIRMTSGDFVWASMLRYYSPDYNPSWSGAVKSLTKCTNEYGASISAQLSKGRLGDNRKHIAALSIDGVYLPVSKQENVKSVQVKTILSWKYMITQRLQLNLRWTERYRTWGMPLRSDIRLDVHYTSSRYVLSARLNFLQYRKQGYLSYIEGGFLPTKMFSAYLKQGVFIVEEWDDRIYSYERDAPGNYNVPAFYGRGLWTSATLAWRFARWGKLYARGSLTTYPFMKEEKPGKAELKLQCMLSF